MHARGAISPNQAFAGIRLPKSREAPQIELMLIFYLDSQAWIKHYYKAWSGRIDKSGTLAKCIHVEGKRFSKPKLQAATTEDA